jgi:serpin B
VSDAARSPADPRALGSAAGSVRAFSADLYRRIASGPAANVVCSPYSVAVALAMTRAGAAGTTAREIGAVLHAPDEAALNSGMNALALQLESLAGPRGTSNRPKPTISLDTANSLWGQQGVAWSPAFLDILARDYGAGMRLADYVHAAERARVAINAWTAGRTHQRIPRVVPPGVLDADTRLVLVNAIYLKAPWNTPFPKAATKPMPFTRDDGSTVRVPMMSATPTGARYATGPGWQAVDLPYAGSRLAMTIVVPDRGRLAQLEASLTGDVLPGLFTRLRTAQVRLGLPRWSFRTQASLAPLLAALGMTTAFTARADFSGMATRERLAISAVQHEAFVAVDEDGTEAAAATAAVMATSARALEIPAVTLVVDRPFLFVIHDALTTTPLFIGRVAAPSPA